MTILSNIFSREKTLFYFCMWNDSDRIGYEDFLGYKVKHNLFLVRSVGEKGSVWYPKEELAEIDLLIDEKVLNKQFETSIVERLDECWIKILPYLQKEKEITSPDELLEYYANLVKWWSAMNTVFTVPDKEKIPATFREKILEYRSQSEKYTEQMNKVFVEFWKKSSYPELATVLTPEEAASILKDGVSDSQLISYNERLGGCFMHNRTVYPMKDLDMILKKYNVTLEKIEVEKVTEFKGRPAFIGNVTGPVRVIKVMADTKHIQSGDILVTEMTNPDYVPFMKIAGAIITDEGSTTCHAAIASRELKIPCIVGTKIATKVLKDGDMVEVNAEKGIVTILK